MVQLSKGFKLKKINKIVIVGGGSSGWMSAATMIKAFPKKEITVIESKDYPIIGVGESTVAHIKEWISFLNINEKDFMRETDATYKFSIKFTDFFEKDGGSFHYPFGQPFLENTMSGTNDWYIKKIIQPSTPSSDYAETFFPVLTLAEENKISWNENGSLSNFDFNKSVAYHFDAVKFGQWLKNKYCLPKGVKLIQDSVIKVNTDENGIESLVTSNGQVVVADLYIDCTGWNSVLINKALGEPFDDFSHILPNNRAWAARVPYTDIEKEMQPYTNCTAIQNGWVWNTPTWERLGTGYVYSDKYVSPEQALEEFKAYLISNKMKVHNPNRNVDSYQYRELKFRTGIHKRTFVKNVVAIGLAAGFIEPLESNGLLTTHEFLLALVDSLNKETIVEIDRQAYNKRIRRFFCEFVEFVGMHYAFSNRTDTEYWRDVTQRDYMQIPNHENGGMQFLFDSKNHKHTFIPTNGIHCIATGMNFNARTEHTLFKDIYYGAMPKDTYNQIHAVMNGWKKLRSQWQAEARRSPTMYKWLKENVYR
jgi:tryptophan halogenase